MAATDSNRLSPGWIGERTRIAGSTYLALAGVANAVTGLWLVWVAGSAWAINWLISASVGTFGELGGLERGGGIEALATVGFPILAGVLLLVAAAQLLCSWRAYGARGRRGAVGVAVLGSINPIALPLGVGAAVLFVLSRRQFAGGVETA